MPTRAELMPARPLSRSGKGAADTAWSLLSFSASGRDAVAVWGFVVAGVLISLWLAVQFPLGDTTMALWFGAGP
jgi:hypothetical protein